jgi:hypothetical protein
VYIVGVKRGRRCGGCLLCASNVINLPLGIDIMSKEIKSIRGQTTKIPSLTHNLAQYELLVEELATENSKLIIENSALKK